MYVYIFTGLVATIQADPIIRLFAQHQVMRLGVDLSWSEINNIRSKLRHLARLLHQLRDMTRMSGSYMDFLRPKFYDCFVDAVHELRKTSKQMAIALGIYIKQIARMNTADAIKVEDDARQNQSEKFLLLYNSSWSAAVAASTLRMQKKGKLNKPQLLPLTTDLVELTNYLKNQLLQQIACPNYCRLQKLILTYLILFNKRRPAEVADMTVGDYKVAMESQDEDREEIMASMSLEERATAERMTAVEVKGKSTRGLRAVFVLIDNDVQKAIDTLIPLRPAKSPYSEHLFAR